MTDMDAILKNLAAEKERIAMTEEMARRVGVNQDIALKILALENIASRTGKRPVDMTLVAQAILIVAKKESE